MIDTKALREKVLDLAIRGELVPQDPNDEPASVLLKKIREQKKQMVKEGKIKAKDIKKDTVIFKGDDNLHYEQFADGTVKCIEGEIPFEVPDGWAWCRLRNLFLVGSAKRVLKSEWKSNGIPFYRAREIVKLANDDYVNNDLFISEEHYRNLKETYGVPAAGDLMVTGVGTIGKVYVVKEGDTFYYKDASVLCFENKYSGIVSEYAKLMIDSPFLQSQIHTKTYGNTVDTITITTAKEYLCALPPAAEQQRIVDSVNNTISLIDSLESNYQDISAMTIILKSKVLDLAIRGKLVPQDQNDEPASILLERIRAEKEELIKAGKIKRDKKESVIFKGDDNSYYEKVGKNTNYINEQIPFELPASWCWCRLGNIFSHNTGKALNSSNTEGRLLTYITTSNLYWDRFELETLKEMLFTDSEIEKYTVKKGDLLVCEGGDIGRSAIWCYDDEMRIQNHIHRLRPYVNLSNRFYYYVLWLWKQIGLIGGQGIGLQGFSSKAIHNLIIPLPPLNEQNRITHMIDELLGFLDTIEQHLS